MGSSTTKKVDVRILAATNRPLAQMVAEGAFREDLYYRLNVIPLNIPPLTTRSEDIEILSEYFLRKITSEMKRSHVTISRGALDLLLNHSWPGNVRELENTLKRAVVLSQNNHIDASDIIFVTSKHGGEPGQTEFDH